MLSVQLMEQYNRSTTVNWSKYFEVLLNITPFKAAIKFQPDQYAEIINDKKFILDKRDKSLSAFVFNDNSFLTIIRKAISNGKYHLFNIEFIPDIEEMLENEYSEKFISNTEYRYRYIENLVTEIKKNYSLHKQIIVSVQLETKVHEKIYINRFGQINFYSNQTKAKFSNVAKKFIMEQFAQ
ncbi:MAG: hypothetical protein ABF750_08150 [Oenococcus oeni]